MKEITEQQIRQRTMKIGNKPAFPLLFDGRHCDEITDGNLLIEGYNSGSTGMTYRQYLIGQVISHPDGNTDRVEYVLRDLAKAELEAEQEVING
jgi:hypothetical protein